MAPLAMTSKSFETDFLSLWEEESLCDVELRTSDGCTTLAHRVVLAARSPFFKAMFLGAGRGMREAGCHTIDLPGLDESSLRLLLRAIYRDGSVDVAADSVGTLLAAASYLSVGPVRDACCNFLRRNLSLDTAADTLMLADEYGCAPLRHEAMEYLQSRFVPICQSEAIGSLQGLTSTLLSELLSSDALEVGSESDVATAVAAWMLGDPQERTAAHITSVFSSIRAELSDAECRAATQAAAAALSPPPPFQNIEFVADRLSSIAQQLKSTNDTWVPKPPRLGSPTQLMAAGGVGEGWRSLRATELYDPRTDTWLPGPTMPTICNFAAGCTLGQRTVFVEGAAHLPAVMAYHRHDQKWTHLPRMQTPRVNMAAAALPSGVFVLGGRAGTGRAGIALRSVEMLDSGTGEWREVAKMGVSRASLAACALDGRIYAVGGQSDRETHSSMEWYDPGADKWITVGTGLREERKYGGVCALGGLVVVVGGMTARRRRLATVEAYDPRSGAWNTLPAPMGRSSFGIAALHGELYVAGGNVGASGDVYEGVECFSLSAMKWRQCAPLAAGRTGLALVPV